MFKNVPISCFLNTFTPIIQTSTSQTSTRAIFRRKIRANFHINFHLSHLRHRRGRQKRGEGISLSSLKKPVLTRFCLLAEVAVQQALEGLAVAGLITGHFMRQAASVLPLEGRRETQSTYKSKHFQEKLEGKRVKPHSTFHRTNSIKSFLKKSTFPLLEGLT